MQKFIRWFRWKDPIANYRDAYSWHKNKENENLTEDERQFRDSMDEAGIQQKDFSEFDIHTSKLEAGPCLIGPSGIIPIFEDTTPSALFNLWMAHTNFNLSKEVAMKIEEVPGVETLDIYTRYRMRIGIGKNFETDKVQSDISKAICRPERKSTGMDHIKYLAASRFPYWGLVISQDEKIQVFGGNSKSETEQKISSINNPKNVVLSW